MRFGDMDGKGETTSDLDPEVQAEFASAVNEIFPENPSARLARACGGVSPRTSQKWISGRITPPSDVIKFVWREQKLLAKSRFFEKLKEFYLANTGELAPETTTAQLARLYQDLTDGNLIR